MFLCGDWQSWQGQTSSLAFYTWGPLKRSCSRHGLPTSQTPMLKKPPGRLTWFPVNTWAIFTMKLTRYTDFWNRLVSVTHWQLINFTVTSDSGSNHKTQAAVFVCSLCYTCLDVVTLVTVTVKLWSHNLLPNFLPIEQQKTTQLCIWRVQCHFCYIFSTIYSLLCHVLLMWLSEVSIYCFCSSYRVHLLKVGESVDPASHAH